MYLKPFLKPGLKWNVMSSQFYYISKKRIFLNEFHGCGCDVCGTLALKWAQWQTRLNRGIHAELIVYIFAHSHIALHTEGNMLDTNWFQAAKGNLIHGEIFSSLGVVFREILSFKNCKISGWQKCLWAHTVFVKYEFLNLCCLVAQKVFNTSGSYLLAGLIKLWPFDIQNWFICSSIRNWIAYSNEANIVNKDSPIGY